MAQSPQSSGGPALKHGRRVKLCAFRPLWLLAIAAVISIAGSCGNASSNAAEKSGRTQATPASASGAAPPSSSSLADDEITTHIVEIKQFKFVPASVTAEKGDRIVWKNLDAVPHTATENEKLWDSGNLNRNDEWSMTVNDVGETDYICAYHPVMKGRIIVID